MDSIIHAYKSIGLYILIKSILEFLLRYQYLRLSSRNILTLQFYFLGPVI